MKVLYGLLKEYFDITTSFTLEDTTIPKEIVERLQELVNEINHLRSQRITILRFLKYEGTYEAIEEAMEKRGVKEFHSNNGVTIYEEFVEKHE